MGHAYRTIAQARAGVESYERGIRSSGKLIKMVDHAQSWQGLEGRAVVSVSRRFEVDDLGRPVGDTGKRPLAVIELREGRSRLDSLRLSLRRSSLRRRHFLDARLVNGARGGNVRVVDSAELVLSVWESAETVAPAVVTFEVPVGARNERHDRGQRQEFDQARRPDDRLAEERREHRRAA